MNFSLYIEGVKVPFSSITISLEGAFIAGMHLYRTRLLPAFSRVQLFVEYDGIESLIFDGFIVQVGYNSIRCLWAIDSLSTFNIGMVDPSSYILNQSMTYNTANVQVDMQLLNPIINPQILIKDGLKNLFENFYNFYILTTKQETAGERHSLLPENNVKKYFIKDKVSIVTLELAERLAQLNTFQNILNNISYPFSITAYEVLTQILYPNFLYTINRQFAPGEISHFNILMPLPMFCDAPKCNLISSPVVSLAGFNYIKNYLNIPTRYTLISSIVPNVTLPVKILPDVFNKNGAIDQQTFYNKVLEDEKKGLVLLRTNDNVPWVWTAIVNQSEDSLLAMSSEESDVINDFWSKIANYFFELEKASAVVIEFNGGFNPYLMPGFPAIAIDPEYNIFYGLISSLNISFSTEGTSFAGVLSPVWEIKTEHFVYSDLNDACKKLYQRWSSDVLDPNKISDSVFKSQDAYYSFVARATISFDEFSKQYIASGDRNEFFFKEDAEFKKYSEEKKRVIRQYLKDIMP